jgi:predicted acyl esterase
MCQAVRGVRARRQGGLLAAGTAVALLCCLPPPATAGVDLAARGSVEQVHVTGAQPGQTVRLLRRGRLVDSAPAGELGGAVFRRLDPGRGYAVRQAGVGDGPVRVLPDRPAPPDTAVYGQELPAGGYGYLETRDGTQLAVNVHLPGPAGDGPYPAVVEYSGYGYADPAGPESGIAPVGNALGYAVVDVNMRGTGCSGGAFDYFERLQALDGYDIIETVARQDWAAGDVGMIGISYGGISQLFVAATRPPSLAAITPLSVLDDPAATLYPGGVLNTGFAVEWARDRDEDAQPAGPSSGQPWAWTRIQGGDGTCEANQALHTEAVNLVAKTRRNRYYRPGTADPLTPAKFVRRIKVPSFVACQHTDEQTGGHCPTLARRFTGTDRAWFTFQNGTHADSLAPEVFNRWFDFLEIYVAKRRPVLPPGVEALAPVLYQLLIGVPGVTIPPDPIRDEPDLASAQAAFEAQPKVRVLFDNGAGAEPGKPYPAFEESFGAFPPARAAARSWYLRSGGGLVPSPAKGGADRFVWDDGARPPTSFDGDTGAGPGGLWTASPDYEWSQPVDGRALDYRTPPLEADTAVVGAGELQVWVRSKARNVDLQATVTEVRPDGDETFVQGGWLRTSARKLDPRASRLTEPVPTFRERDAASLPEGRWVKVRIPLYYESHVYRAGSRIRALLSAPGGDQPIWAFAEAQPDGTPWVAVAHTRKLRSRLVLPVVPGLGAGEPLPPCPSLRGQPCRDYEPLENRPFQRR